MTLVWPRRSPGLPPGQRLLAEMPRFTDTPFSAPPVSDGVAHLTVCVEREPVAEISAEDLEALVPNDHRADFHCVTTWSVKDVLWTGVPLRRVLASVGITEPPATHLVAIAADHRRGHFVSTDALADDVLVATALDGRPLGARHGGPLRLVAPQHYGYKSVKHLERLDFRAAEPTRLHKEHLRGRVAHQERHPKLPSRLVALPYRLLIAPTAYAAERSLRRAAGTDHSD